MSDNKLVRQHNRICMLLDYYGDLLTSRRQQILNMSIENDLSLSEIAEKLEISRQAVHDNIQKAIDQLEQYEIVLGMATKDRALLNKLDQIMSNNQPEKNREVILQLKELKAMIL